MRFGLYTDNTLPLPLVPLCDLLNRRCNTASFVPGESPFRLSMASIRAPSGDEILSPDLLAESSAFDWTCLATNVPYDNNHFFDSRGNRTVISFSGWNSLTDLPVTNGFVYFIASILAEEAGIGTTHNENTGCINDFWWDKTGVDIGMKAAYICGECVASAPGGEAGGLVADVRALLDSVSHASWRGEDILAATLPDAAGPAPDLFDAFLCHNSDDKDAVERVKAVLNEAGVRTWFDRDQVPLGMHWQDELEAAFPMIRAVCVFAGPSGMGPWHRAEVRAFLNEFMSTKVPVIPVLLPGGSAPGLPIFLRQRSWVDLRQDEEAALDQLAEYLVGDRR